MAMIGDEKRHLYGVQFHPEVAHTNGGSILIENFVRYVCGCIDQWTPASIRHQAIERIREQIGTGKVIAAVSGGVDSAVAATLVHEAVGDQLTCIFIDNGLLRLNEADEVVTMFRGLNISLIHRDASALFLERLKGIVDPEQKRKIIGGLFIDIFEEEAHRIGDVKFLVQGTIYPDIIESVSVHGGPSSHIKSHHNVGGLPARMNLNLIEPLRELFKDEVRELGTELGLPDVFLSRHPFPGPGLGIRIPGEITPEKLDILRRADHVYQRKLHELGLYNKIWQAPMTLLSDKTTGVVADKGVKDGRAVSIRAVCSTDGMTAEPFQFIWSDLQKIISAITSEVRVIVRVLYDATPKPPGTIEWE